MCNVPSQLTPRRVRRSIPVEGSTPGARWPMKEWISHLDLRSVERALPPPKWLVTETTIPQQKQGGVGWSWAPPTPTEATEGGRRCPWSPCGPGGRRPAAGGVTVSHKSDAWVETGFTRCTEEIWQKCWSLDWRLKAQVSDFPLFYFGANSVTVYFFKRSRHP